MNSTPIPALRFHSLTRAYDWVVARTLREQHVRAAMLRQVAPQPNMSILDVGCGTGTFCVLAKQHEPRALVTGLDVDGRILELARAKARIAGAQVEFQEGAATRLPFAPASFDCVVSSLLLHHLTLPEKQLVLEEIYRVLRPGGAFHLLDWDVPASLGQWLAFWGVRLLDGLAVTQENVHGDLIPLMMVAGFQWVDRLERFPTVFGTLGLFQARKGLSGEFSGPLPVP